MRRLFMVVTVFGLLFSCGPSEEELKVESLHKELMEGHDKVMPMSMRLPKLKASVLESVADLEEGEESKTEAMDLATSLTQANDAMYTWMDNFAVAMNDIKDTNEKLKRYELLNIEINEIGEATKKSIEMANKFIKDHE